MKRSCPLLLLGQDREYPAVPPGLARPPRPLSAYVHMPAFVDEAPAPSGILRTMSDSTRSPGPILRIAPCRVTASRGSLEGLTEQLLAPLHRFNQYFNGPEGICQGGSGIFSRQKVDKSPETLYNIPVRSGK